MRTLGQAVCALLMLGLALAPAYAAEPAKRAAATSAKAKAQAQAKAKAKAKAATKAKLANKAKPGAGARAGSNVKASTAKPPAQVAQRAPALSPQADPPDEASLDAQVIAARRVLAGKPGDADAGDRLARASMVLIDWVLRAEAVGESEKAERLTQKLVQDLHDTALRVQKMAQKGDAMALQASGFMLARGLLLKPDPEKSCGDFLVAAEKLASAGWHAAQCLMEALPEKGWEQMQRAAQRGHAAAQEWMGRRCLGELGGTKKDYVCARDYFVQSASQGRPRAQTLLAYLLVSGQGGPVNLSRAVTLYTAAAEKGDVNAQNNLGEMHETGRGVSRNMVEAMRWYERAADQGFGPAQFNAGRLWAVGVGQKKDPVRARALLVQAEAKGISQARQVLDWLDQQAAPAPGDTPALKPATTLGAGNGAKE